MNQQVVYTPAQIRSARIQQMPVEKFVKGLAALQVAYDKFRKEMKYDEKANNCNS